MEAIGMGNRVAPIARSPLDSARGRRKHRRPTTSIVSIDDSNKPTCDGLPSPTLR
jgi:hypothetical protein